LFGKVTLFIFGTWRTQGISFARKQTRNLGFVRDIRNVITILERGVTGFCKSSIRHCNNEFSTSAVQLILKQLYVDPTCGSVHRDGIRPLSTLSTAYLF
jgi:hypothetical protein